MHTKEKEPSHHLLNTLLELEYFVANLLDLTPLQLPFLPQALQHPLLPADRGQHPARLLDGDSQRADLLAPPARQQRGPEAEDALVVPHRVELRVLHAI